MKEKWTHKTILTKYLQEQYKVTQKTNVAQAKKLGILNAPVFHISMYNSSICCAISTSKIVDVKSVNYFNNSTKYK